MHLPAAQLLFVWRTCFRCESTASAEHDSQHGPTPIRFRRPTGPGLPPRNVRAPRLLARFNAPGDFSPSLHFRNKYHASRYRSYLLRRAQGESVIDPFRFATIPCRDHVPKIQRNHIRRHKIEFLQNMRQPLPRWRSAGVRVRAHPARRRLHLHPVNRPVPFHHQVIRRRISPWFDTRNRCSAALPTNRISAHSPRSELFINWLTHRPIARPRFPKHKRRSPWATPSALLWIFYSIYLVYQLAKGDWDMFASNICSLLASR